jgi:hypothetical protein
MRNTCITIFAALFVSSAIAYDFDFTSAEGFANGSNALNGQQNWEASGGIQASPDAGKEWLFLSGSGQYGKYTGETLNPNNGTITMSSVFKFSANPTASSDIFNIFKLESAGDANNIARIYFRYGTANDDYRIRYSTGNGFDRNTFSTNSFTKAQIGLDDNNTTDNLNLTWTFTKGADAASWAVTLDLVNESTGNIIDLNYSAGTTYSKNDVTVTSTFNDFDSLTSGFNTSGINSGNILSFSGSAVPEPGQVSLIFGAAAIAYLMVRRRQK